SGMGQIILDRKVLTFGLLVGGCNGILFSYFAEGPFLFIETLKQDPNIYGMLTFFVAIPWAIGGMVSSRLCKAGIEGERIILLGSLINLSGCLLFLGFTFSGFVSVHYGLRGILSVTIPLMVALTGIGMMIPNCLSQALDQYKNRSGSAASLFGFFYYLVIAALTYVMGTIHDGTVVPIPNQREDTFFMV
ncbi:MAG: multidrug effflux MFS transporter, partial [bacterium]|nr:multidrug effflux MFS transporter [bacterium]